MPRNQKEVNLGYQTNRAQYMRHRRAQRLEEQIQKENMNTRANI